MQHLERTINTDTNFKALVALLDDDRDERNGEENAY